MKDPAVLWYMNDWGGGTRTMSRHLKGCYMDLLEAQFNSGPLSLEEIKTVLGTDFAAWGALSKKFKKTAEGLFFNERMEAEKAKRKEFSNKQKERVLKRWYKSGNQSGNTTVLPLLENVNENENRNINDNDLKGGVGEKPKTWKTDFETYKSELDKVYQELIIDSKFITEQEKYHPGVDISLSLEKSVVNFWGTEAGWKHKKKGRAAGIDWKMTLINAIDLNKVYKPYGNSKGTSKNITAEARKQQEDYGVFKPGDQPGVKLVTIPD